MQAYLTFMSIWLNPQYSTIPNFGNTSPKGRDMET